VARPPPQELWNLKMVHKISSVSGIMNNNTVVFWNVITCHLVDANILVETAASTRRSEVWAKLQETVRNIRYDQD
jgi:hypothetical protein